MPSLYVIPARDESVAIILRRGPTSWYHIILWNTRQDTFIHGAWFKGRIYEERCDLSPDGKLFVYFVRKSNNPDATFTHAWTAVSRPPWMKALVVWPQGSTWGGGGKFVTNMKLSCGNHGGTHPDFPVPVKRLKIVSQAATTEDSRVPVNDADWSGYDHSGHVTYTRGHLLFRRKKLVDTVVADFSELKPDPQPAPDWASRPL